MKSFLNKLYKKYFYINWIAVFILYHLTATYTNNALIFPSLSKVFQGVWREVLTVSGLKIVMATLKTVFLASVISLLLGSFFSALSKKSKLFKFILAPFISIIKSLPTMGVILLVILYWKLKNTPLIVGIGISLGMIYDLILSGVENIDKKNLEMAELYQVSKIEQIKSIYIPSVYFYLSRNFHSLITLIFKVVIAGEVIAGLDNTIGGELMNQKNLFNVDIFFAWLIGVIFISNGLELIFKKIDKLSRKWEKYD